MTILFTDRLSSQECSIGAGTLAQAARQAFVLGAQAGRIDPQRIPATVTTPAAFAALGRLAMEMLMTLHNSSPFAMRLGMTISNCRRAGVDVYTIEPLAMSYFNNGERSIEQTRLNQEVIEPFMVDAIRSMLLLADGNMARIDLEDAGYIVQIPQVSTMTMESFACRPLGSGNQASGGGSIFVPISIAALLWLALRD